MKTILSLILVCIITTCIAQDSLICKERGHIFADRQDPFYPDTRPTVPYIIDRPDTTYLVTPGKVTSVYWCKRCHIKMREKKKDKNKVIWVRKNK